MSTYAVSDIDQFTDAVQAFQGNPYTTSPLPSVNQVVANNGMTKWNESDCYSGQCFGGDNYYAISAPFPFTIKINGVIHTAQIFTGRPPIVVRPK